MQLRWTSGYVSCALFLVVMICLPATAVRGNTDSPAISTDTRDQISRLIAQLGHENFRVRLNAQAELEKIGLAAYEQLREAVEHSDIQIARSAEYLLRSQNVIWWVESDSHEVRSRLQDYSSLNSTERQTRLMELANLGTDDALVALCRVAKFESSELCSRAAAISLLRKLTALEQSPDSDQRWESLCQAILITVGRANRPAVNWLQSYAVQSLNAEPFSLNVWKDYVDKLNTELSSANRAGFRMPLPSTNYVEEQKLQVLQFYEWMIAWIRQKAGRQSALEVAQPSLDLVSNTQPAMREYSTWALSIDLPELVVELLNNSKRPPQGQEDQQLYYLLAESHRKLNNEPKASEVAARARQIPNDNIAKLGQLAHRSANAILSNQRIMQAMYLDERGMFDWEEAELIEAIALAQNSGASFHPRYLLAEHYREGKQYAKAVETLGVINESAPPDKNLPLAEFDYSTMLASYHWYRALAAQEAGKQDEAIAELRTACEAIEKSQIPNPDIIINLYRLAKKPEDQAFFRTHFNRLVEFYRLEVTQEESRLAEATVSIKNPQRLAASCNQLAWLLASCETNLEEAIYLSQRSLDFDPDMHTHLDTMARCCYAAGRYEDAVAYQVKALKGSPHNRSMKAQLVEFQQALEKQPLQKSQNGNGKN